MFSKCQIWLIENLGHGDKEVINYMIFEVIELIGYSKHLHDIKSNTNNAITFHFNKIFQQMINFNLTKNCIPFPIGVKKSFGID